MMIEDGITFRTDGYPGSIEDSQSLNLYSGPSVIRFGNNKGKSISQDIDIYCDLLSKYDN